VGASGDLLFGKLATGKGYCTQEQVDKCVAIQAADPDRVPLGRILVQEGFLSEEQHSELLALQRKNMIAVDPLHRKTKEATLFGKLAVHEKLVTEEQLNECLRLQARDGEKRTLGEIMVSRGYLNRAQVEQLLGRQLKKIMSCPACQLSFTVVTVAPQKKISCPRCRGELREGKPSDSVRTDAEFATTIVRAMRTEGPKPSPPERPAPPPGAKRLKVNCIICNNTFEDVVDATGRVRCPSCHVTYGL